jgi:PhnB protein
MKVNPYLTFDGNCEEAFKFYERALGAKIVAMVTFGQTPMAAQTPAEAHNKIAHARLGVGDQWLMGSDGMPGCYEAMKGFSVTLNVDEPAEAERVFRALAEGGSVRMPIAETFWAKRFGMVTDRFGTPWMINCEKPMGAPV